MGNVSPLAMTTADGTKLFLSATDCDALDELGYTASIDDCGHVLGTADPEHVHRSHPHLMRITDAGRAVIGDAGEE